MSLIELYENGNIPTSIDLMHTLESNSRDFSSRYHTKNDYTSKHGFVLYSAEEINILKKFIGNRTVVDVGCGHGFLMELLKPSCPNYVGVDSFGSSYGLAGEPSSLKKGSNSDIIEGDAVAYMEEHTPDIVVMIWPDYTSDFAHKIVSSMKDGSILIYKGEGIGGCTADTSFFSYVDYWKPVYDIERDLCYYQATFEGLHDSWRVLTK